MDFVPRDWIFYAGIIWMIFIATITLLIFTGDMFEALFKSRHFVVEGRTVLITGGSQGLGRALGKLLASKGANIIIVARNAAKLQEALTHIKSAAFSPNTQTFHSISADLTDPVASERVLDEATRLNGGSPPDIVWANAGSAHPSLLLDVDIATLRSQMDINYWAALYLARASLKIWLANPSTTNPPKKEETIESKSEAEIYGSSSSSSSSSPSNEKRTRHFIITSSTAAWVGVAGYAPYATAKAALRSLHDNLRSEMALYNGHHASTNPSQPTLKCAVIHPGTILSPGFEEENQIKHPVTKMLEADDPPQTEEQTAAAAIKGLEKGYAIVTTQGLQGSVMRGSSMQGSVRDRWVGDTFWAWLASIAWLFVAPDMERKVFKWGKEKGISKDATS